MAEMVPPRPPGGRRVGVATAGLALVVLIAGLLVYRHLHQGQQVSTQAVQPQQTIDQTLETLRQVDPALVKYREARTVQTGFQTPRGIALSKTGELYVVGDRALRVFEPDGSSTTGMQLGDEPTCVAVDDGGKVAIGYRGSVEIRDDGGAVQAHWQVAGKSPYVTCVALSGEQVWVADAGDRVVLHYDRTGQLLGRLGEKDPAKSVPGLFLPSPHLDVVPLDQGRVLVNNTGRHQVETYTAQGELKSAWGRYGPEIDGFPGCCNPTDLALLPDGKVVASDKGLPRVKVYNQQGTLQAVVATPAQLSRDASALDLAVSADGAVYVLDGPAALVRVFVAK